MAALHALRRRVVRALPADRRVKGLGGAHGRGWLQARKLVAPLLQVPVVLKTADGLRLRITADPVDEEIAQYMLGSHRREYFPPWPADAPPVRTILDIGGHHGLYAAAALHEYPDARIICVEPSADAVAALQANLSLNHSSARARVLRVGLADGEGEGVLRHTDEGSWGASLYEEDDVTLASERVALASLAQILDGAQPEIVKCNAEGAEYSLFEQLAVSDVRPTLIIAMVHPEFGDVARVMDLAAQMGYSVTPVGRTESRPVYHLWRAVAPVG
jgi:FkbM family methyltransferase